MLSPKSLTSFVSKAHPLRSIPNEPEHYELDVPGDGTCLFYSVAFAYLLPSLNDKALFKERFAQLFGEEVVEATEENRQRLLTYDGSPEFIQRHSEALEVLVNVNLRQRLVDYMQQHPKEFAESISGSFEDYVTRMRNPALRDWGGQVEIKALSELLKVHITVYERTGEEIKLAAQSEYGQAFPNRMYLVHTLTPEGLAMGAAAPRFNNHYHFLIARQLLDKPLVPEKKGSVEPSPETLEMHFERLQTVLEQALQSYDFIGHPFDKESTIAYNYFQDKIKSVLDSLKKALQDLQEMLMRFQKTHNKMLLAQLNQGWANFERKAQQELENLQKSAQQLNPPLPANQQQYLSLLITEVSEGFKVQPVLRGEDWLRLLKQKLLESTLSKLAQDIQNAPSVFISYAWGNIRQVQEVHCIARHLKLAGIQVKLDVWDNTKGSILAFTSLIETVDSVIVVGTPALMAKWKNFTSEGVSLGKIDSAYRGNVIVEELKKILARLNDKPNGNHGIVNLLLEGEHRESFPDNLRDLPSDGTDFRQKTQYTDAFFNLLLKLPIKDKEAKFYQEAIEQQREALNKKCQRLESWGVPKLQSYYQKIMADESSEEVDAEIESELNKSLRAETITWNLPHQNYPFIGRETLLQELAKAFSSLDEPKDGKEIVAITSVGLGGVDKTHLVLKYLTDKSKLYSLKAWFSAESKGVLEQQYLSFAKKLGYAGWLLRNPGWLLVFDNVVEYKDIEAYLPKGQGHILITSRNQDWPGKVKVIEIEVMEEQDAIKLLRSWTQVNNELQAEVELIKALGCLPLAIAQAGAYIKRSKISISAYLDIYQNNLKEMLENNEDLLKLLNEGGKKEEDRLKPVATTWKINFETVYKVSPMAAQLLVVCAYLSSQNIPRALLLLYIQKEKPKQTILALNKCLTLLSSYSLIQISIDNGPLAIHSLVQKVIQVYHQVGALQKIGLDFPVLTGGWYNNLLEAVNECFDFEGNVARREELQSILISQLQSLERNYSVTKESPSFELAKMRKNLGLAFDIIGKPASAMEYFEKALASFEEKYGKESPSILIVLGNLANAYGDLGNFLKKEALLKRCLEIMQDKLELNEVIETEMAKILGNLGNTYGSLGNIEQQEVLLQQALAIFQKYPQSNELQIANTLVNLGALYEMKCEPLKKKEVSEDALKILNKLYGVNHIRTVHALTNLANAYGGLKEYNKQKNILENIKKIEERYYERNNFHVAETLNNLAVVYGNLGNFSHKKELLEQALQIKTSFYGEDHIMLTSTIGNLANAYGKLGDMPKKISLLNKVLAIYEKNGIKNSINVGNTLYNLANAYSDLGDFAKQEEYLGQVIEIYKQHLGEKNSRLISAQNDLKELKEKLSYRLEEGNASGGLLHLLPAFSQTASSQAAAIPFQNRLRKLPQKPNYYEIDVPVTDVCLFYSAVFAYLLPSLNNRVLFAERFLQLFGEGVREAAEDNRQLLLTYDGNPDFIKRAISLEALANVQLRARVAAFMQSHQPMFSELVPEAAFKDHIEALRNPSKKIWGGPAEIKALSELLKVHIVLYELEGEDIVIRQPGYGKEFEEEIALVQTVIGNISQAFNAYHYLIEQSILKRAAPSPSAAPLLISRAATAVQSGVRALSIEPQSQIFSSNNVNGLEFFVDRITRTIEEALCHYQFIGISDQGTCLARYRELQQGLKAFLESAKQELNTIDKRFLVYKDRPNEFSLTELLSHLEQFKKITLKKIQGILDKLGALGTPLPAEQKNTLLFILDKIRGDLFKEVLKHDDWIIALERRLLDLTLEDISRQLPKPTPTCFISYSWADSRNVAHVHQIAQDLKRAGIDVKLDVWENTAGSVIGFTDQVLTTDYVILVETPDLVKKWHNFQSEGVSRKRMGTDYTGNVVVDELKSIIIRVRERPKNDSGVIKIILEAGNPKQIFPQVLDDLACATIDFCEKIHYVGSLFNLLVEFYPNKRQLSDRRELINQKKSDLRYQFEQLQRYNDQQLQEAYNTLQKVPKNKSFQELKEEWDKVLSSLTSSSSSSFLEAPQFQATYSGAFPFQAQEQALVQREIDIDGFGFPPYISSFFTKRTVLLEKLSKRFGQSNPADAERKSVHELILCACVGQGGVGKTQLALQYADVSKKSYGLRVWFNAGPDLEAQYLALAERLGYGPRNSLNYSVHSPIDRTETDIAIRYVKDWLNKQSGWWLLIFDNAENYNAIERFLPSKGGHILATSLSNEWPLETILQIDVMQPDEATDLLRKLITQGDSLRQPSYSLKELASLAKMLGYLPLALAQAATYISNARIDIKTFNEKFQKSETAILSKSEMPTGNHYLPFTVNWDMSVRMAEDRIRKQEGLPLTRSILTVCAYLHPDNISHNLLLAWMEVEYPAIEDHRASLNQILTELNRYSLIKLSKDGLSLHRLAQVVLQDQHKKIENLTPYYFSLTPEWYARLLKVAHIEFGRNKVETADEERQSQLLPHLKKLVENYDSSEILNQKPCVELAFVLEDLSYGGKRNGGVFLKRALGIKKQFYKEGDVEIANSCSDLGSLLEDVHQGKIMLEQALSIQKVYYPPDHIRISDTLYNLGKVYLELEQIEKAREFLEEALDIEKRRHGPTHKWLVGTLRSLAKVYEALGDHKQQKQCLNEVVNIRQQLYTPGSKEYSGVVDALVDLSEACANDEDAEQIKYLDEALGICRQEFKPDSEDYWRVGYILIKLSAARGVDKKARRAEYLQEALTIYRQEFKPGVEGYEQVAAVLLKLSKTCPSEEKAQRLVYLQEALNISRQALKPGDKNYWQIAGVLVELSDACATEDKAQKLAYLKEALDILRLELKPGDEDYWQMASVLENLSDLCEPEEREQQLTYLREALDILRQALRPGDSGYCQVAETLGKLSDLCGPEERAQQLVYLKEALAIFRQTLKPGNKKYWRVAKILIRLSDLCEPEEREQQLAYLQEAITILRQTLKPGGREYWVLANALTKLSDLSTPDEQEKRVQYLEEALDIFRRALRPGEEGYDQVAAVLVKLSDLCGPEERKKQFEYLEEALDIFRRALTPESEGYEQVAAVLIRLSALCEPEERAQDVTYLKQALPILQQILKPGSKGYWQIGSILLELSNLCTLEEKPLQRSYLEKALAECEKGFEPDSEGYCTMMSILEQLSTCVPQDKALQVTYLHRALSIGKQHFKLESDHYWRVPNVLIKLSDLCTLEEQTQRMEYLREAQKALAACGHEQQPGSKGCLAVNKIRLKLAASEKEVYRETLALPSPLAAEPKKNPVGHDTSPAMLTAFALNTCSSPATGSPQHVINGQAERVVGPGQPLHAIWQFEHGSQSSYLPPSSSASAFNAASSSIFSAGYISTASESRRIDAHPMKPESFTDSEHSGKTQETPEATISTVNTEQELITLERALVNKEQQYGKDHLEIVNPLNNLASAYGELGDFSRQLALLMRALNIQINFYGKEHPKLIITLNNLASAYGSIGEFKKQKELLAQTLDIQIKFHGKNHPTSAVILSNLANAYGSLGDAGKQRDLLEEALSIFQRVYGSDNVEIAKALVNLGNAYGSLGDARKQRGLLERALNIFVQAYGNDHPLIAVTLGGLASAYERLENYTHAAQLLERALYIFRLQFGENYPEVAHTLNNLGNVYRKKGDLISCQDLLMKALTIQEKIYGKEHVEVAKISLNLGSVYNALGDKNVGNAMIDHALKVLKIDPYGTNVQTFKYGEEQSEARLSPLKLSPASPKSKAT